MTNIYRDLAGCYESSVSLRVQGRELDFDAISLRAGVIPSQVRKAGTLSRIDKKNEIDTWIFDSKLPTRQPLDSHIGRFVENLPNIDRIKSLRNLRSVENVDMFCALSIDSTACRIYLSSETLKICLNMDSDLEISLVFGNTQVGDNIEDKSIENSTNLSEPELKERSNASLRARVASDYQASRESLQFSSDAELMIQAFLSNNLRFGLDWVLQTEMIEGKSPDDQLRELDEALRGHIQKFKSFSDANYFTIESRFETNCEWGGTRLSQQAYNLPVHLNCPLILEAVLI